MNREYNSRVSSKNSERLLKNLQNTIGDYFFLPHPVHSFRHFVTTLALLGLETPEKDTVMGKGHPVSDKSRNISKSCGFVIMLMPYIIHMHKTVREK